MKKAKEFIINEYITLKLEGNNTNIYIMGEKFIQCKSVLLNIHPYQIDSIKKFTLIDDFPIQQDKQINIPPETEFWCHCSNLQVWVENGYNTRLLHSNIAFPLLKKLAELKIPKTETIFKEEIIKRINSGNINVIKFLIIEDYLKFLNKQDLEFIEVEIISEVTSQIIDQLIDKLMKNNYKYNGEEHELNLTFNYLTKKYPFIFMKLLDKLDVKYSPDEMNLILIFIIMNEINVFKEYSEEELNKILKYTNVSKFAEIYSKIYNSYTDYSININENEILKSGVYGIKILLELILQEYKVDFKNHLYDKFIYILSNFDESFKKQIEAEIYLFFRKLSLPLLKNRYNNKTIEHLSPNDINEVLYNDLTYYVKKVLSVISKEKSLEFLLDKDLKITEKILITNKELINSDSSFQPIPDLIPLQLKEFVMKWITEEEGKAIKDLEKILRKKINILNGAIVNPPSILIDENRHIVQLDLTGQDVQSLSVIILKFKFLEKLNLSYTKLIEIPMYISELNHLNFVNLSGCKIIKNLEIINNLKKKGINILL